MFDSLKKRLKEAVEKVSKAIREDKAEVEIHEKIEPKPPEKPVVEKPTHEKHKEKHEKALHEYEKDEAVLEKEAKEIIKKDEEKQYEKLEEKFEKDYVDAKLEQYEKPEKNTSALVEKKLDDEIESRHQQKELAREVSEIEQELKGIRGTMKEKKVIIKPDEVQSQTFSTEGEESEYWKSIEKKRRDKMADPMLRTVDEMKSELGPSFGQQISGKLEDQEPLSMEVTQPFIETEKNKPKVIKAEIEKPVIEEKEKKGLFTKIFEKTISEEDIKSIAAELEMAMLENDVAIEVAERICDQVRQDLVNKSVRRGKIEDMIRTSLRQAMLDVMSQPKIDLDKVIQQKEGVFTIVFLGFNGTGKTTTLAKFAKKFKYFNPIVAAGDTFRAASIEQLEEHSRRVGFRVVKHQYGADSAAVIFDAKRAAIASGSKLVLADTAGRAHSNVNLMDELKKLVRVNQPDMKILVLDSITGNDIFEQSRLFDNAVGVDAIILTKADVYDRGGAALSASQTIRKPILYLGVGQEYDDLKEFEPTAIVDNLLK